MNLEDLKRRLETAISTNKLMLSGTLVGSQDISNLLSKYFGKDELEILGEETAPELKIVSDEVQVLGKVTVFGLEKISVVVKIAIQNDSATLVLPLNLPQNWKFPDSFSALESPHFINLEIIEGKLILNSSNYTDELTEKTLTPGLNFVGQANLSGNLTVLTPLLGSFSQFPLRGAISSITPTLVDLVADFPDLTLSSIEVTETKLKFTTQEPEPVEELEDPDEDVPVYPENFVFSEVFIEGAIKIGNSEPVRLFSEVPLISDSLFLRATFPNGVHLPSLDDLATLTGTANLLQPLPEQLRSFGSQLAMKETSFWFNIKKPQIQRAEVKITSQQNYNLFQGLFPSDILRTEKLDFTWFVQNPMSQPQIAYAIDGRLRISDAYDVDIQIQTDSELYLFIGLAEGNKIELDTLISQFLPGLEFFPSFAVESFGISALPSSKTYGLNASLEGSWEIIEGVELFDLEIEADYDGNAQPKTSGKISGLFIISEVGVYVETSKQSQSQEQNGWEFSGSNGSDSQIKITELIEDIASLFKVEPQLPQPINDLIISDLHVSFNTATKDFYFACYTQFSIEDKEIDITVTIDITRQADNSFNKQFGGYITIGDLQFNLIFSKDNTAKTFLATYNNPNRDSLKIQTLVEAVSGDIATYIPATLEITLQDALFIYSKNQTKSNLLFGLNLSSQINLSNLPLAGRELPPEQSVGVDDLQFIIASQNLNPAQVNILNNLIPDDITKLPLQPTGNNARATVVKKGLNVSANLQVGNTTQILALPITPDTQPTTPTLLPSATPVTTPSPTPVTDNSKWYPLKKHLGTLYFARIGIQYKDADLWFLLDASISAAGLTLNLDGLSVGSPLKEFKPKFKLQGIGIKYESKGAVSIEGAFLRTTINGKDNYSGSVIVKTETFTLSAIGSYTTTDQGHPSLFIYGVLDKPIGGPPFFFVTGIALGFAYNRSLILPTLDQIPQFPLVRAAIKGAKANPGGLIAIQRELQPYIPPKVGQVMLAVGIKFTSFKIIDSFVLLVATLGDRFSLELLGISTLISPPIPPGVNPNTLPPPLAQVRFGILARFVPSEGTLQVEGKILPDSYLFARDCLLSGGFAFYSWFSGNHEGDFVLTVGGYHPRFRIPAHYPRVDPLTLNWRISDKLSVKGSMYFALTASAMMAGGRLEAVWQSGSIKAWFIANAHFIVAWQPYSYDARIGVNLGASYTFWFFGRQTISIEVGADLHIWGPKFSGTATIKLYVVSFTVRFGSHSQKKPDPLNWSQFKESFLPAKEKVCTITVESGLLRKIGEDQSEIFIVNPKEFIFTTSSVIPLKKVEAGEISIKQQTESGVRPQTTTFGIAPMDVNHDKFTESTYSISLVKIEDGNEETQGSNFECTPIAKNIPTALWGESNSNNPNRERFINNVLSGYKIRPANPPTPGETQEIPRKNLAYDTESVDNAYQWDSFSAFSKSEQTDEDIRERNIGESITSETVNNARNSLLQSFGLSDTDIDLEEFTTEKGIEQAFIIAPELEEATI